MPIEYKVTVPDGIEDQLVRNLTQLYSTTFERVHEPDKRLSWIISGNAREIIGVFSVSVLQTAELIRNELGYTNNPEKHFFPYNMRFRFEAPSRADYKPSDFAHFYHGNNKYLWIGSLSFRNSFQVNGLTPKDFEKADEETQVSILKMFLDKLEFTKGEKVTGDGSMSDSIYRRIVIHHPNFPFAAEYLEQNVAGYPRLPTLIIYYYETNEHQLPLAIEETVSEPKKF